MTRLLARLVENSGDSSIRFDANETAFLERELTQLRVKLFEVQYPDNVAMSLIPLATDIAGYADTYSTPVLDRSGRAKIIGNGVTDVPRVDIKKDEILGKVFTLGAAYGFELMELRKAAALGIPIEMWKPKAARAAVDDELDSMLTTGKASDGLSVGLTGLVNNASVTVNTTAFTVWASSDADTALLAELAIPASLINVTVKNKATLLPNTLALAPAMYDIIANKQVANTTMTVLKWFLANNPYITSVVQWSRLSLANAGGSGPRAVMYRRDPLVLEGVVPVLFEQLPPQAVGMELITNVFARCGACKVYHPEAILYLDHTG
jgi:hypothetical protein